MAIVVESVDLVLLLSLGNQSLWRTFKPPNFEFLLSALARAAWSGLMPKFKVSKFIRAYNSKPTKLAL